MVRKLLSSAAPMALLIAAQAQAQSTTQDATRADKPAAANAVNQPAVDGVPEIVVTALKRSESVLKAPVAVTVLTPQQLRASGVVAIADLTSTTPNLQLRTVGSANAIQITVRGITNTDFNQAGNPSVATYIDGVYVGHTEGLVGALYDLQRIEVLRGPQGTLYGRNSTGGNLNIITADPEHRFGAYADVSYGNYQDVMTHGVVNLPLTEDLAIRAAFVTHRSDGYYDTRGTTARNYGAADDYGGRITALWTPGNFSWRLSLDDYFGNGTPGLGVITGQNGKPVDGLPVYNRPVPSLPEPLQHTRNLNIRSHMTYKVSDAVSLSYVAGYERQSELIQATVSDGGYAIYRPRVNKNYSNEVDLNLDIGRLQNIAGVSQFHMANRNFDMQNYDAIGITEGVTTRPNHVKTSAWGVFDQATYNIAESLRVIGGVRYSSERQTNDGEIDGICPGTLYAGVPLGEIPRTFTGPGCFILPAYPASGKWSDVTWKAGAQYDISAQTSSYITVSTGFKSGGTNAGSAVSGANATFQPEKDINYELGIKTRLFDRRLSLNTAVFYTSYTDIQVTQIVNQSSVTTNAAKATIYGVELEGQWLVTPLDHLSGFATYLHATYKDYKNAFNGLNGTVIPSLDGNYLQNSPKWSFRAQYAHDFSLPNGAKLTPMAAVYWQARSSLSPFNQPIDHVGAYTKTDLNLTYSDSTDRWSLTGFVNNLEDKAVRTNEILAFGRAFSDFAPPRTYGLRLSFKY